MNPEQELLVPHGVERVAVDGLGAEVAAVQGHPQHVDLDAGAARAVAGANILARHDLQPRRTENSQWSNPHAVMILS